MSALAFPRAPAVSVEFEAERFVVELSDGRAVAIPYAYSPRLWMPRRSSARIKG